ncbi:MULTISPECIES: DUF2934 domain-containing protein [unclassified Bradyrhizobium]|uniref:DUF2934 domain-containing protein n=1 Tax=unclassified Bradyrhizobium TaxID=2631580 RepID=UPI001FFAB7D4|nr:MULTISPECIES: DUF2934 domain-containing protein [unclassified Bradyrhizobium]
MAGPSTQKDIECRAYELWQQAGMPEGRDQEFYLDSGTTAEGGADSPFPVTRSVAFLRFLPSRLTTTINPRANIV